MLMNVVLGATGGWGSAIIHELVRQGKEVRGVNRSGKADVPPETQMVAADVTKVQELVKAIEDASIVYHCVNLPYYTWEKNLMRLTETIISAVEKTDASLMVADNLYMYPEDAKEPLHEEMPWNATTRKGRIRAKSSKAYLKAHEEGRIKVSIVRAPDFFGPRVTKNSFYGSRLFENAIKGKKVLLVGRLDMPHQIAYTPDLAKASIMVAEDKQTYGQVWHLPTDTARTQKEFAEMVFQEAGTSPKIGTLSKGTIRVIGLFNKVIREVHEMYYEFEKPYLVSHEKFMKQYKFSVTPLDQAVKQTLEWFKRQEK